MLFIIFIIANSSINTWKFSNLISEFEVNEKLFINKQEKPF